MVVHYPKVSIAIPIHNRIGYTIKCLDSLKKVEYPYYTIIIIDDGSTDGSWKTISTRYPYVRLLKGDGTLWWAGATNLGIKYAIEKGTDFILTLNNDVIVHEKFLSELVKCALENPDSLIGSKIMFLNEPERVFSAGGIINWHKRGLYMRCGKDCDQFAKRCEVDWLTGMSVLIPKKVFNIIGYYDDKNFPQYTADAEFSMRAKKNGFRLIYEPRSLVWNAGVEDVTEQQDIKTIIKDLFSIKSPANIRRKVKLYIKYCPKHLILNSLIRYYAAYFKGCFVAMYSQRVRKE
ncbi:MAG: hypothetical protein DRP55_00205 [Spirochaetes bacterium]|nr:MAG: hypothetical protein DRP55_00205 [Spirochaetota bacterium]